jgi:putative DNA primase/helicase
MSEFVRAIARWKPVKLIVFDTLSRCIPGAEENSAKDLGEALAACDELRLRTQATVMLLHHPRKDGLSERGSSKGFGDIDTQLWLDPVDQKNGLLRL